MRKKEEDNDSRRIHVRESVMDADDEFEHDGSTLGEGNAIRVQEILPLSVIQRVADMVNERL